MVREEGFRRKQRNHVCFMQEERGRKVLPEMDREKAVLKSWHMSKVGTELGALVVVLESSRVSE